MMFKKKEYIFTSIFLIIIFIFPILHITIKDKDISIIENRYLKKLPKFTFNNFISGDFSKDISEYLDDHFPFRDTFISIKSYFDILLGRTDINNVYLSKDNYLIEMFNNENIDITNRNIELINNLAKEVNVSVMLIPTSTEILKSLLPPFATSIDQKQYLKYIEKSLDNSIKFISPINILNEKNNEYIYYLTDHHYTTLGAYYSYLEFCKKFNITPIKKDDFNIIKVSDNFLGSLYSKVSLYNQKKDSIFLYIPKENKDLTVDYGTKQSNSLYEFSHLENPRTQYNIFLDNNHPLIKISSSIKNGKKLAIIKDSYANSFIPFLTNHFEELHVIDLRFYKSNIFNYLKENNINDVLFYYNIKNFSEDRNLTFIDIKKEK